jgi:antitoxin MazE
MSNAVRARIVRIGNSQGLRIPKPLLEQAGFGEEVELEVNDGTIIIRAAGNMRHGWAERFRTMAGAGDDQLLDADTPTRFDEEDWVW